MKMITNLTHLDIQVNTDSESRGSTSYSTVNVNNDMGEEITSAQLISCISAQFDQIYKENQKRKYLLKEISAYFVK